MKVAGVERKGAGEVEITGRVTGPLATRAKDRVIEVRRQVDCGNGDVIAKQTRVRNAFGGRRLARTYSLPRVVEP